MSAKVAWDCYGVSDARAQQVFADMAIALQPRRDAALAYSFLELARRSRSLLTAQSGLYQMDIASLRSQKGRSMGEQVKQQVQSTYNEYLSSKTAYFMQKLTGNG